MALKQPVTQKRLTNIAVVRLKSHGKRFEIACYKNKVLNWREGIEKDLDEVIQTDTIFTNVSKGVVAKEQDLQQTFGTVDNREICIKILKTGDLQVSDREREVHMEGLFRDIVQIVVERCVHPQTGRQLTALTVDNALRTIGFSVQPDHAAKKQALKAIEALCTELPESFSRAKMRLSLTFPERLDGEMRRRLVEEAGATIEEEGGAPAAGVRGLTFVCDPSRYRELDRLATVQHAGEGVTLHIIAAAVISEGGELMAGTSPSAPSAPSASSVRPAPGVGGLAAPPAAAPASRGPAATPPPASAAAPAAGADPAKKGPRCSSCNAEFDDAAEYRKHCRSDWHNYNLKRKVKGLQSVSEEEFAEISLDVREGFSAY